MQAPILLDTTLRDGEQSPGIYFTHDEKIRIASALDQLGIPILEAGIPSMGKEEQASLRALQRLGLQAEILSWNRLLEKDIIASIEAEMVFVHLSIPTSDIMLKAKIGKTRDWLKPQMERVFRFANDHGLTVSFGAEDSSRTDSLFLKEILTAAQQLGAKRVRVADTLGIMMPQQVSQLIAELKQEISIPIDFHGHNDFGLATANALAAWESGAEVISCSLLGLGERAGNTSLEELAAIIHYLRQQYNDFDFIALKSLCERVSQYINMPLSDRKPLFGAKVFTHESGIHVDGLLKDSATYEFYSPEQVGRSRTVVVGKHSGRKAIRYLAGNEGYTLSDELIDDFLSDMRRRMSTTGNIDASGLFHTYLRTYALKKQI